MSIQVAKQELDRIVGSLRAFQDAQKVIDVLANIEQVTVETQARLDARRADLVDAEHKLRVARETSETLLSHAKAIKAQAEVEAKKIISDAMALADRQMTDAQSVLADLDAQVKNKRTELEELAPLVASAQADLDGINAKLLAAKEAKRKALED